MSNTYSYTRYYRNTRYGGYTKYIAICTTCKRIIPPVNTRRSRGGTHGEDYYVHEHPLDFLLLYSSNKGNRAITIPDILRPIQNDLEMMWIYKNVSVYEIVKFIDSYLSKL